jgi:hypothetical protein
MIVLVNYCTVIYICSICALIFRGEEGIWCVSIHILWWRRVCVRNASYILSAQGISTARRVLRKVPISITNVITSKIALHRTGEKRAQRQMGRYYEDGFTLKKKIRDSLVGLTKHRDHTWSGVCSWRPVKFNTNRISYHHWDTEESFLGIDVQLHTRSTAHPLSLLESSMFSIALR